jgi:hypothetical protein
MWRKKEFLITEEDRPDRAAHPSWLWQIGQGVFSSLFVFRFSSERCKSDDGKGGFALLTNSQKSSHIVINLLLLVWGIKCIEILESYVRMSRPDVTRPIGYVLGPALLPRPTGS